MDLEKWTYGGSGTGEGGAQMEQLGPWEVCLKDGKSFHWLLLVSLACGCWEVTSFAPP